MSNFFGNTLSLTGKSLDYLWLKQTVSLNNIANNDTPGFKAKYVTFEDHLKKNLQAAGKSTRDGRRMLGAGISRSGVSMHQTTDAARLDGNNVQVEAENTELVRSYLQYQAQIQSINSDIAALRTAITGQ